MNSAVGSCVAARSTNLEDDHRLCRVTHVQQAGRIGSRSKTLCLGMRDDEPFHAIPVEERSVLGGRRSWREKCNDVTRAFTDIRDERSGCHWCDELSARSRDAERQLAGCDDSIVSADEPG